MSHDQMDGTNTYSTFGHWCTSPYTGFLLLLFKCTSSTTRQHFRWLWSFPSAAGNSTDITFEEWVEMVVQVFQVEENAENKGIYHSLSQALNYFNQL